MSFGEDFIQFRTSYLRAIARAWRNSDYRDALLKDANAFNLLKDFGFQSHWPKLILNIKDSAVANKTPLSQWCPEQAGGWIGANDEFHLSIPTRPQDPGQWSEALAAYYQLFPTLFGPLDRTSSIGDASKQSMAEIGSNIVGGSGAASDFLEFGAVMMRALALSWKFPKREKPQEEFSFTDQLLQRPLPTLSAWLGYNSPWNFDIYISQDTKATWVPSQKIKDNKGNEIGEENGFWDKATISPNRIVMYFPEAPQQPLADRPIALAAYNSTGPQYPFTCE